MVPVCVCRASRQYSNVGESSSNTPIIGVSAYSQILEGEALHKHVNEVFDTKSTNSYNFIDGGCCFNPRPYKYYARKLGELFNFGEENSDSLDCNHSHFILTNGKREDSFEVWYEIFDFIRQDLHTARKIPSVMILVGGELSLMKQLLKYLKDMVPIVVMKKSGGLSDRIIRAISEAADDIKIEGVKRLELDDDLRELLNLKHLIVIHDEERDGDIDSSIFFAVIKVGIKVNQLYEIYNNNFKQFRSKTICVRNKNNNNAVRRRDSIAQGARFTSNLIKEQIKLALIYDQFDFAFEQILENGQKNFSNAFHHQICLELAILMDKPNFVDLLMSDEYNITMLTSAKTLNKFYSMIDPSSSDELLCKLGYKYDDSIQVNMVKPERRVTSFDITNTRSDIDSHEIDEVLLEMQNIGIFTHSRKFCIRNLALCHKVVFGQEFVSEYLNHTENTPYRFAFIRLLEYCLFAGKFACARVIFIKQSMTVGCGIATALGAYCILKTAAPHVDMVNKDDIQEEINFYEEQAKKLLDTVYKRDKNNAPKLMARSNPEWGGQNIFEMAMKHNCLPIIQHGVCQQFLDECWFGNLEKSQSLANIVACMLCPFLVPVYAKFSNRCEIFDPKNFRPGDAVELESMSIDSGQPLLNADPGRNLSANQKLYKFYTAPVTKFCFDVTSQLCFVILFGNLLLRDMCFQPTYLEYLLLIWFASFLLTEVRQFINSGSSVSSMTHFYFKDFWNCLDLFGIIAFMIGFMFRLLFSDSLKPGWSHKTVICPVRIEANSALSLVQSCYCLSYFFVCLKTLNVFTITKRLGPLVIQIRKMLVDMVNFLFVLSVFIIGYGVIITSFRFPNHNNSKTFTGHFINHVIMRPYWQIYGELFLDDIQTRRGGSHEGHVQEGCVEVNTIDDLDKLEYGDDRCPNNSMTVEVLSAIYMLLANILLLNLLIALFASTYERINQDSDAYWKFQRAELVKEYKDKPTFPFPFNIPNQVAFLFKIRVNLRKTAMKVFYGSFDKNQIKELQNLERVSAMDICPDENQRLKNYDMRSVLKNVGKVDWDEVTSKLDKSVVLGSHNQNGLKALQNSATQQTTTQERTEKSIGELKEISEMHAEISNVIRLSVTAVHDLERKLMQFQEESMRKREEYEASRRREEAEKKIERENQFAKILNIIREERGYMEEQHMVMHWDRAQKEKLDRDQLVQTVLAEIQNTKETVQETVKTEVEASVKRVESRVDSRTEFITGLSLACFTILYHFNFYPKIIVIKKLVTLLSHTSRHDTRSPYIPCGYGVPHH